MPIEFRCDHCDKLLRTADDKAGLSAQCPGCGAHLIVPHTEESVVDELELDLDGTSSTRRRPKCPMCGTNVHPEDDRCRNCGELLDPDEDWKDYSDPRNQQAHRGVTLLVCSIVSWFFFCFLFSIPVWIIAEQDLKSMRAGIMNPEGEGLTRAAKIIAMCHVLFTVFVFFAFCCLGAFAAN
ncbi:Double zinc ribbon [Polystyrenella longa]|uniref:Double zinc ribbon n=1 Tax=Polystyrenella longa TaxID=2528007 RepID=A0A518CL43_9PLAN|nr:hypothetical protein [Polystyrenella longa]QDU79937.1 Double zinc ribbon [Polystyrenella longa]